MKNGEDKQYKTYIRNLINELRMVVFAGEYELDVQYPQDPLPTDDGNNVQAEIITDHVYLCLVVRLYPDVYEYYIKKDYSKVTQILLHELCHVFTQELYEAAKYNISPQEIGWLKDIWERQTQRITYALFEQLPKRLYTASSFKKNKLKSKK